MILDYPMQILENRIESTVGATRQDDARKHHWSPRMQHLEGTDGSLVCIAQHTKANVKHHNVCDIGRPTYKRRQSTYGMQGLSQGPQNGKVVP